MLSIDRLTAIHAPLPGELKKKLDQGKGCDLAFRRAPPKPGPNKNLTCVVALALWGPSASVVQGGGHKCCSTQGSRPPGPVTPLLALYH